MTAGSHRAAPDPLAPEETLALASEPPRRLGVRAVFAALALLFFLGPGLLVLSGGGGEPLAREQHVSAPRLSRGWDFFNVATRYLTQRLPLRDRAVDANTWISKNVFGVAPRYGNGAQNAGDQALPFGGVNAANANGGYAQTGGAHASHPVAVTGRDGWIFLQGEIDNACDPPVDFHTAAARWSRFVRIVRASGRSVVLMVAPEKSTIYPELVAPKTIDWKCAHRQKARLWSEIESIRNPDVIPLREALLELKRRYRGEPVYEPLGSHWNDISALELVRRALERVGRGVRVKAGEVRAGTRTYKSDIAPFAGQGEQSRPGPARTIVRTAGDRARVIGGRTLFLHDSYGDNAAPLLAPYAGTFSSPSFLALNPRSIVDALRQSDTVIVETVERDFVKRAAVGIDESVLTPRFLDALPGELGSPP
jgi:alginate O-acetyltransferase complex protein AlgJ